MSATRYVVFLDRPPHGRKELYVPGPPDREFTFKDLEACRGKDFKMGFAVVDRVGRENLRADIAALPYAVLIAVVAFGLFIFLLWLKGS